MKWRISNAILAVLATAFLASVPSTSGAYSISLTSWGNNVVRWDHADLTYYLDPNGAPDIYDGSDVDAMHDSFAGWQAVNCSKLTFQFLGNTSNKSVLPITGKTNGKNELVYINNSAWDFGKYVLGVTSPMYYWDGVITEADIAMNGYLQSWSTTGGWFKVDVKSVAIHEIGHLFGLQHVLYGYDSNDPPTMAPQLDPNGLTATLTDDDKMGACFLYPQGGYYTCTNDTQCPYVVDNYSNGEEYYSKKVECEGGYCTGLAGVSPGSVGFGGTCNSSSDCEGSNSCEAMDSGLKLCTKSCDPYADNCPDGFHCQNVYTSGKDLCVAGSKKLAEGDPCMSSYECETSFCYPSPDGSGMFCRIACTVGGSPCPGGKECWSSSYSTTGGCFPPEEVPHTKLPLGSDCTSDLDCKSDVCFGEPGMQSLCRKPCNPDGADCYSGYYCANIGGGRSACLPGEPPTTLNEDGAMCDDNTDCLSNWCVKLIGTDQGYCRRSCSLDDWACPWGTSCVSYGSDEFGVCMPSVDKAVTGETCTKGSDCVTGICWTDDQGAQYCTQNCINGWCPNDMECVNAAYFGTLCSLPSGTPPVEVQPPPPDNGPVQADQGTDLALPNPQNDAGTAQPDTGWQPASDDGTTCAAGTTGSWPAVLLLAAAFILLIRRRPA